MPISSQPAALLIVITQGPGRQTDTIFRAIPGHARGGKEYGWYSETHTAS